MHITRKKVENNMPMTSRMHNILALTATSLLVLGLTSPLHAQDARVAARSVQIPFDAGLVAKSAAKSAAKAAAKSAAKNAAIDAAKASAKSAAKAAAADAAKSTARDISKDAVVLSAPSIGDTRRIIVRGRIIDNPQPLIVTRTTKP